MRYRVFTEDDFEALSALDLSVQRHLDARFDALPEREREGRLRTSLASLRFYLRSEHSFVAEEEGQPRGADAGAERLDGRSPDHPGDGLPAASGA